MLQRCDRCGRWNPWRWLTGHCPPCNSARYTCGKCGRWYKSSAQAVCCILQHGVLASWARAKSR